MSTIISDVSTLVTTLANVSVTCIKLAPIVFHLTQTLEILAGTGSVSSGNARHLAIVGSGGRATLDGGSTRRILTITKQDPAASNGWTDVAFFNLKLQNGKVWDASGGAFHSGAFY